MSVTKSFFGTIGAMLVADGTLDENAKVSHYVPELKDSAFGDATVRQVLDMTTGLAVHRELRRSEGRDLEPCARRQRDAAPARLSAGPSTFYDFLQTVKKEGEHGEAFAYKTVNTDALGWVIAASPASRWARTCGSASGASSAPSRTPTSRSTASAPSSPAAASTPACATWRASAR